MIEGKSKKKLLEGGAPNSDRTSPNQEKTLVCFHLLHFPNFLLKFSDECFFLSIFDGGRLFKVLAFFPFTNNAFFLYHPFEALYCLFQVFAFIESYLSYWNHHLSLLNLTIVENAIGVVKQGDLDKKFWIDRINEHPGLPMQMGSGG